MRVGMYARLVENGDFQNAICVYLVKSIFVSRFEQAKKKTGQVKITADT